VLKPARLRDGASRTRTGDLLGAIIDRTTSRQAYSVPRGHVCCSCLSRHSPSSVAPTVARVTMFLSPRAREGPRRAAFPGRSYSYEARSSSSSSPTLIAVSCRALANAVRIAAPVFDWHASDIAPGTGNELVTVTASAQRARPPYRHARRRARVLHTVSLGAQRASNPSPASFGPEGESRSVPAPQR
jgi:hypothetical protein